MTIFPMLNNSMQWLKWEADKV